MKATYWQKGESLDYHNGTKNIIEAGDVLTMANRIGVAGTDINPGETGSVHVTGVFELDKKDQTALLVGTEVYLCDTGITATAGENVRAGFVAAASAATDKKVYVKINA